MRYVVSLVLVMSCHAKAVTPPPQSGAPNQGEVAVEPAPDPFRALGVLVTTRGDTEGFRRDLEGTLQAAGYQVVNAGAPDDLVVSCALGSSQHVAIIVLTTTWVDCKVFLPEDTTRNESTALLARSSPSDTSDGAWWRSSVVAFVNAMSHSERIGGVAKAKAAASAARLAANKPAESKPAATIVAVFDVEDGSHVFQAQTLDQLTDYLTAKASEVLGYHVLPRDQIRARLVEEKKGTYRACVDQTCQIELGKALAASRSLATKVLRVGKTCAMTTTVLDLKTETAIRSVSTKTGCDDDALINGVDQLLQQLRAATTTEAK